MSKKKKKKNINPLKLSELIRREGEIKTYGKLISTKPEIAFKSKKAYKRKWKLSDYTD